MKQNNTPTLLSDSDPALFERMVLLMVDQHRSVFDNYKSILCHEACGGWHSDFEVPVHNALYRCIRDYHNMLAKHKSYAAIDMELLRAFLTQQASEGSPDVGLDEVDEALEYMSDIRTMNQAMASVIVTEQMPRWLRKRRLNSAMRAITRVDGWDPEIMMDRVNKAVSGIRMGNANTSSKFGDSLDGDEPPKKRYPIPGFNELNMVMSNGFVHGEYSLFMAGTGGGKTVMALQLAVGLAMLGLRVVFFTTEQPPRELEPRIISAFCNIPFAKVRDGVDMKQLAGYQRNAIEKLRENIDGNLFFEDWSTSSSRSIEQDMDTVLDSYESKYGKVDAVVFDWLGGGLGELDRADMHVYRLLMTNASNAFKNLAATRDMIVISFAQLNLVMSKNKKRIDPTMLAESKSLGNMAANVYGISCMMTPEADIEELEDAYKDEQYLYAPKSRKAKGKGCKMWRDFDYQRFTDRRPVNRMLARE